MEIPIGVYHIIAILAFIYLALGLEIVYDYAKKKVKTDG